METTMNSASTRSSLLPMTIIGVLFFIFGFVTWLNGSLNSFRSQFPGSDDQIENLTESTNESLYDALIDLEEKMNVSLFKIEELFNDTDDLEAGVSTFSNTVSATTYAAGDLIHVENLAGASSMRNKKLLFTTGRSYEIFKSASGSTFITSARA